MKRIVKTLCQHSPYIDLALIAALGLFLILPALSRAQTAQIPGGVGITVSPKPNTCPHRRVSERSGGAPAPVTQPSVSPPPSPAADLRVNKFDGAVKGERFAIHIELSAQPQTVSITALRDGKPFILGGAEFNFAQPGVMLDWSPKLPKTNPQGTYTFALKVNGKQVQTLTITL